MSLIRFHPAATDEAEATVRWYGDRSPGLDDEFRLELLGSLQRVAAAPKLWPRSVYDLRARRFLLPRFPYAVVYVLGDNDGTITIVAVAHERRHPRYWLERL